ncbi:MAG: C25 family cysteine peptidase, partial [Candidatus Syntrophosphaera sp.]
MTVSRKMNFLILLAMMLAMTFALNAKERMIDLADADNQALLANNGDFGFDVHFKVGDIGIREVQTRQGAFDEIFVEGWGFTNDVGEPKLPMLRRIISVPLGAEVRYTITSQATRKLDPVASQLQNLVIPAQEPISKSADPATLPFVVNDVAYSSRGFNDRDWIRIEELGMMRGVRLIALEFYPLRYDPASNSLQVMQEANVRVDFLNPDLAATRDLLARTSSHEFDRLYAKTIFNWNADERTELVRHPTKMLILCPVGYTANIQDYVDWKIQQGIEVDVATVGTGGDMANTTSAIISYMEAVWNAATAEDPAPTYLLIIGDESGTINVATNSGATGSHVTDLTYVRLNGTDYLPEMYHGRFSASSATELATIIQKTITFEKTQMPDISYLGDVVMIAGYDTSFASTHGNGAINYGTENYFNTTHGITSDTYLYPASGSSDAQIIANANEGRGYMNYTAHGSQTSWANPTFSVSDVNSMTNSGKYGLMVGNCCITNEFDYSSPCFGEAVIRKADGGGVAYIGGINSTYWDEDYYWAVGYKTPITGDAPDYDANALGAYDGMFHDHGEAYGDWAQTTGEVIWMGNLAVAQSGSSITNYYWEIYHIMGDPSLMPYYGVPTANTASYPSQIFIGQTEIDVTGAAPYSRIAITMDGVIHGSALTDANGNLTLALTPFTTAGTATLVITAQNSITLIEDIDVIANAGPWMSVTSTVWDDANNDMPDYDEGGYLDVTFKNVGTDPATGVTTTLTTTSEDVTITENTEFIASLAPNASTTIDNAYALSIDNGIFDGTIAEFTITMTDGNDIWTKNFNLILNAPDLEFGNISISDPSPGDNDGSLDPGETVTITIPLYNNGGATSISGSASLVCATPGISVNAGSDSFTSIAAGEYANLTFSLTADESMSIGTIVSLEFDATAGMYAAEKTETITAGLIMEDFESGDFASYDWEFGAYPWTIDNSEYYSGSYSARSGAITNNQSSTMEVTRILSSPGEISFWYKVSSEANYDYLRFAIDGTEQNAWSGTVDWTQASFNVDAGTRTFTWTYSKDGSVASGSDCAWVDDVIFPGSIGYTPATITWTPGSFEQQLGTDETATQTLTIGNAGNETLTYTVSKPTGEMNLLDESFESASLPAGWSQEHVTGTVDWEYTAGGQYAHPASAYDGSYNARLYYNSSYTNYVTKLITLSLDLESASSATLSFWHTQEVWAGDQDQLKVYYRTSPTGAWNQLAHYTASIADWTQETFILPSLSATYQIAFEGITSYGYGVCLDKVVVSVNDPVTVDWLTVNGGDSQNGSINSGEADQNINIGFNSAGLSDGVYT